MHKNQHSPYTQSIRFRRWSRKRYAVFNSMHRHVTIGEVCRSIADAALSKTKSGAAHKVACIGMVAGFRTNGDEYLEESPGLPPLIPETLALRLPALAMQAGEACSPDSRIHLIIYRSHAKSGAAGRTCTSGTEAATTHSTAPFFVYGKNKPSVQAYET